MPYSRKLEKNASGWIDVKLVLRFMTIVLVLSFTHLGHAKAQASDHTTLTVYETVENIRTVTSTLGDCGFWTGLPKCNQLTWAAMVSNASTAVTRSTFQSISSTVSIPETTSISAPLGGFVLEDPLRGLYLQFADDTGTVVLTTPGQDRLVALKLDDGGRKLLQNSRDLSEIVLLRYNASADGALNGESPEVLSKIRQIRYINNPNQNRLASDYIREWIWNTTTGRLELHNNGITCIIYQIPSRRIISKMQHRALAEFVGSYDLYMLPEGISISDDSALKKAYLVANKEERYETSYFSSRSGTSSSTKITSTSTKIASTSTSTSSPTPTSTLTSSSSVLPDAYDVITSLELQGYCNSLLSYISQTITTTSNSTFIKTSYSALFTEPSLTLTSTTTVGKSSVIVLESANLSIGTRKRNLYSFLSERSLGDALTAYPSSSVLSACSKAVTSPTEVITDTIPTSLVLSVTEPISSTTFSGVSNYPYTATVPVVIETVPAIGYYKLVHSDLSDHSSTYYGQFLADLDATSPGYMTPTAEMLGSSLWTPYYIESIGTYGLTKIASSSDQIQLILCWLYAGSANAQQVSFDYAVYLIPLDFISKTKVSIPYISN